MIQSLPTLAHCSREKGEGRREEERRKGGGRKGKEGKRRGGREERGRDERRERAFKPLFQADSLAHTDLY